MEEEIKEEVNGETQTPSEEDQIDLSTEPQAVEEEKPSEAEEKIFTQSKVNEIIGNVRMETREKTREKIMQELFGRYGVESEEEMNDIFGRGQSWSILSENAEAQGKMLQEVQAENALLKSGIREDRWEDARAILKGKGLEITRENIENEIGTHPEWKKEMVMETPITKEKPSVIKRLGEHGEEVTSGETEEAKMKRLFNL